MSKVNRVSTLAILGSEGGPSDTTRPTVTITLSDETTPTFSASVTATITFSEAVVGFVVGDITVGGGGSLSDFATADNTVFTATWTFANGTNTLDIAEGVCADEAGNTNTAATQKSVRYVSFVLRDDFTDTVAAGAVNGTNATPTGGTRTATDTNSKLSIGSGVLSCATGAAANNGLWYGIQTRAAGKTMIGKVNVASGASSGPAVGWNGGTSGMIHNGLYLFNNGTISFFNAAISTVVGAFATGVDYRVASVLRAAGNFALIKGGAFTNWTLMFMGNSNTANQYPTLPFGGTATVATVDFARIPTSTITITPLASDAFTRANGVLGNTGGGGSEESGGSGLAWVSQLGTWAISTNKAVSSALDGTLNISITTVPCGTINTIVEAICTRSAGNAGIVLRYADSSNYIVAYHDGTNIKLDKVVAGTPTNLISVAVTYSATARTIVSCEGTKFRLYYGDTLRGTEQTISDASLQTGQAFGLYTSDTGATFDNFVVWARGNGGEYSQLDAYINP